ncbi:MAG: dephospho-CoA kinase [Thermodesulfobacteriota bacterium]|nr:dephospho-CoA kinase [Thermodesulfobacteriota bacterium]
MVIAGLTGGIATGKSTVASILRKAGAVVIDADEIARDVVRKGLPAWKEIVEHFGKQVLCPEGEIDRKVLGDIIFNNAAEKEVLNNIVHPKVFEEMNKEMDEIKKHTPDAVVILDIPLLIESDLHKILPDVIVVYAPKDIQLERLIKRDHLSKKDAMARINSQMSIEEKRGVATIIIDNSSNIEKTRVKTLKVLNDLKRQHA